SSLSPSPGRSPVRAVRHCVRSKMQKSLRTAIHNCPRRRPPRIAKRLQKRWTTGHSKLKPPSTAILMNSSNIKTSGQPLFDSHTKHDLKMRIAEVYQRCLHKKSSQLMAPSWPPTPTGNPLKNRAKPTP